MSETNCMMALRLFGLQQQQVEPVLKQAAEQGCPGLRLLSKENEFIICVNAKAETLSQAQEVCDRWEERFRQSFGPAVFGKDETELTDATLDAMAQAHKLFVAADETTGRMLEQQIRTHELARVVYDFGQESYRHPKKSQKISADTSLTKKYPGCLIQPLVGRTHKALAGSGADWAVSYSKPGGTQPGFVVVCDAKNVWVKILPQSQQPDELAVSWMLDMLRRLALGLDMAQTVEKFGYGKKAPELPIVLNAVEPILSRSESTLVKKQSIPQDAQVSPVIQDAAQRLFDDQAELPQPQNQTSGYSSWERIVSCLAVTVIIACIFAVASKWMESWQQGDFSNVGYGTADYDSAARDYLLQAQSTNSQVAAYLALPKLGGTLIYQQGSSQPVQNTATVLAAQGQSIATFAGDMKLGTPHSNVVLTCPEDALQQLSQLDNEQILSDNSGFTIYTDSNTYRYKIAAVYYWDPNETGATAFDLYNLQDLNNYQDFLTFVLGMKARSLYDMPVDLQDNDQFATLVADTSDGSGQKLVITGRQQREDETGILNSKLIVQADQPLLPLASYQSSQQPVPTLSTLQQYWMNWYLTGGATSSDIQEESGMPTEDEPVQNAQELEATQTPSEQPDASETPDPSGSPSPSGKPTATPKPTATATSGSQATQTPAPATQAPTPAPTPTAAPAGPTITVTMNGVRQEMDLAECLAMIARAELGANAPIEAYKAQMVAAHSWILNQGGAPSVTGREPSQAIRQAANEVANVIVTYNGRVAFTPYFASAAYGTNPSEDVWGSSRPYLVAVESPYDQQYATNWKNTRVFTVEEVAARASEKLGQDLYAYSDNPADWMGDLVKNSSGYVTSMRVGNATITGMKLQENVLAGFSGRAIRSAAFDISYSDGNFSITTYGYGHGCGMSQYGAWGYAANGWSYQQILAHYYPGTSLSTIG